MLKFNLATQITIVILSIVIIICSIGIIIASKFQKKQNNKYKECLRIIKEKEGAIFQVKNGLNDEEINSIDSTLDVNNLMTYLYNLYLNLVDKEKNLDNDFDNVLTGTIKEIYVNKINNCKISKRYEITDGIELIGYSITDFSKDSLDFRLEINCHNYKMSEDTIVSGSNLEKVKQILIISYKKINDNWLINNIQKVYESKINK